MKTSNKKRFQQRKILEQKIQRVSALNEPPPPSGWIKAIRQSLGLSIRQLAELVGVSHGSISQIEGREPSQRVTLESLQRLAHAMDCQLVYAIVPKKAGETLNGIIQKRAQRTAMGILSEVQHTMRLENQGTSDDHLHRELERITQELIESGDSRIWQVAKNNNKKSGGQ